MASENPPAGDDLAQRVAAAFREVEAGILQLDLARSRLEATRQRVRAGRAERQEAHDAALARLIARLGSESVIEQAKGIVIAQTRCTADEALALLRAAARRGDVRVGDLARNIVDRAAAADPAVGQPDRAVPDQHAWPRA